MKLFKKKQKSVELLAPTNGEIIELSEVKDPIFSTGMMGSGFAVIPSTGQVNAPIAGEITMIAETKHGIGIQTTDGLEILIHMGIDTVELEGKPFEIHVKVNERISVGQLLATVDLNEIKNAGKDTTIIVVITNSDEKVKEFNFSTMLSDRTARVILK